MARKRKRATKAEAEAGARNLAKWKAEHPEGARLAHGAYSKHIRKRYSDKRTTEGKRLDAIVKSLIQDIGPADLSAGQCLIIDRIREKLIVLMQIGKYVDNQLSLINERGELLPCLGKNYTTYSESLRRDLLALSEMASRRNPRVPTIEDIMARSKEEGN